MFCPLLVSQGEADGVSTSGDAGVFIPYLYLFCISKSKNVVLSDWRCKVTAVSGSFQQISCFSPRVVMTLARFAWHPYERLSYVSCQGEKSAKNMLNNGLMMAPFHFASFIPLPRLLSLFAYKITTFLRLTSSQFILTHPNSSILILINLCSPPPATLLRKPCLFTPLPMPPDLIKDRTLSI